MDKPSPNNPHLHDWLSEPKLAAKPFDANAFDPKQILEGLSASFGPMKVLTVQQMEFITLASRRAQAYLGIPQRLARCRTQSDVVQEQMRFWQTASSQYQDTTSRIANAWAELFAHLPQAAGPMSNVAGIAFPKPGASSCAPPKPASNRSSELIRVPSNRRRSD
jgi:hypothetical protein